MKEGVNNTWQNRIRLSGFKFVKNFELYKLIYTYRDFGSEPYPALSREGLRDRKTEEFFDKNFFRTINYKKVDQSLLIYEFDQNLN